MIALAMKGTLARQDHVFRLALTLALAALLALASRAPAAEQQGATSTSISPPRESIIFIVHRMQHPDQSDRREGPARQSPQVQQVEQAQRDQQEPQELQDQRVRQYRREQSVRPTRTTGIEESPSAADRAIADSIRDPAPPSREARMVSLPSVRRVAPESAARERNTRVVSLPPVHRVGPGGEERISSFPPVLHAAPEREDRVAALPPVLRAAPAPAAPPREAPGASLPPVLYLGEGAVASTSEIGSVTLDATPPDAVVSLPEDRRVYLPEAPARARADAPAQARAVVPADEPAETRPVVVASVPGVHRVSLRETAPDVVASVPGVRRVSLRETAPDVVASVPGLRRVSLRQTPPEVVDSEPELRHVSLGQMAPDFGSASSASPEEKLLVEMINVERTSRNLRPVVWDPALTQLAKSHGADMRSAGKISHHSTKDGADFSKRLARTSYRASAAAENVAYNFDVVKAHRALMRSPGHRENILTPGLAAVGTAVVTDPRDGWVYVVEDFATPIANISDDEAEQKMRRSLANAAGRGSALPEDRWLSNRLDGMLEQMITSGSVGDAVKRGVGDGWTMAFTSMDPSSPPASALARAAEAEGYALAVRFRKTPKYPFGTYWTILFLKTNS